MTLLVANFLREGQRAGDEPVGGCASCVGDARCLDICSEITERVGGEKLSVSVFVQVEHQLSISYRDDAR